MGEEQPALPKDLTVEPEKVPMAHEGVFEARQYDGEFVVNPENGMLVSDGQEYANTPRVRWLIERGNEIRSGLPPVVDGYTRLWRGNRPGEIGKNPSFTNSLEGIALPFLETYGGELSYVDVLTGDLEKYEDKGCTSAGNEFILPAELAERAQIAETKFFQNT